jgi:hypothetical protein
MIHTVFMEVVLSFLSTRDVEDVHPERQRGQRYVEQKM